MKTSLFKTVCLATLLLAGAQLPVRASYPQTESMVQADEKESEWKLLQTKDGVSCYWKIDLLGAGNGVYLRFVNATDEMVNITWQVSENGGPVTEGKLPLVANTTAEANHQPAGTSLLSVRVSSSSPVISFNVSK
jgi:hypothetical protein